MFLVMWQHTPVVIHSFERNALGQCWACVGRTVLSDAFDFYQSPTMLSVICEQLKCSHSQGFVGQECPTHTRLAYPHGLLLFWKGLDLIG